jgi:thiol-disulfide isomerase/thioredoxin
MPRADRLLTPQLPPSSPARRSGVPRHPRRSPSALPLGAAALLAALVALAVGQATALAQDIHLTGLAGERLSDADLAHGATIIVVWASWSPRSRDVVERVQPLASRWGARARVVTVDFEEERPVIEAFLAGKALGVPVFLDTEGAFSKKYAIATLPGLLVIKDGKSVYHGKLPDDPDRLITDALR